jgi:hypothetical protein
MFAFVVGVACGAQTFFYFTQQSDLFVLFLIKMFAFVVGVACGAQKFLYFTSKMTFSCYF